MTKSNTRYGKEQHLSFYRRNLQPVQTNRLQVRKRQALENYYATNTFSRVISFREAAPHIVMVDLSSPTILSI